MTNILCLIGLHDWRPDRYFTSPADEVLARETCTRCRARRHWRHVRWLHESRTYEEEEYLARLRLERGTAPQDTPPPTPGELVGEGADVEEVATAVAMPPKAVEHVAPQVNEVRLARPAVPAPRERARVAPARCRAISPDGAAEVNATLRAHGTSSEVVQDLLAQGIGRDAMPLRTRAGGAVAGWGPRQRDGLHGLLPGRLE